LEGFVGNNNNHGDPLSLGYHRSMRNRPELTNPLPFGFTRGFANRAAAEAACRAAMACNCDEPTLVNPFFGDVPQQISAIVSSVTESLGNSTCGLNWQQVDQTTLTTYEGLYRAAAEVLNGSWPCQVVDLVNQLANGVHVCNHDHFSQLAAFRSEECDPAIRAAICTDPIMAMPQILEDDSAEPRPQIVPAKVDAFLTDVAARLQGN
jgi:hypothetical protein